jgi:formylglycine-generating enzyme required for sulfatase activity
VALSFIVVPGGTFTMGDGVAQCGWDEHDVTLTRSFYFGQYEVTNQQYLDLVQWAYDNGYVTASQTSVSDNLDGSTVQLVDLSASASELQFVGGVFSLRDAGYGFNPGHPVKAVTWFGSAAFCDWLSTSEGLPRAYDHATWQCNNGDPYGAAGYRLPTDAEWEYVAQFDDERIHPWGNETPDCSLANWWGQPGGCVGWTSVVGSFPTEKAIDGLAIYDMGGNVWEWCNDWFVCDLGTGAETDPLGPLSGEARLLRGGLWNNANPDFTRSASRVFFNPEVSGTKYGLRCARTVPIATGIRE